MPLKNDCYTYRVTWSEDDQEYAGLCKRYSGKCMVRVPPEVHRSLAIQASESGVSLNRIAGAKLSR
jgi:predicted HicB family RNase H-like nuclease